MRKFLVTLGAAMTLGAGTLAAQPNLSGASDNTAFVANSGATSFSVEFLYGFASNDNTLFYQLGGGSWEKLFTVFGAIPAQTATPPGNPFTVSFGALASATPVSFALCQGNLAMFSECGVAPGAQGPFLTGPASTQARYLTAGEWNSTRGAANGVDATLPNVFAFEDITVGNSDQDFNDLVFATNLTTVVPEPSTYALMAFGLMGMVGVARRKRQA